MELRLEGRRALVTGASRGLGKAIASALVAEGTSVVAVARNVALLNELVASSSNARGTLVARACDLTDAAAITGMSELLADTDILVANTGGPPPGSIMDVSDAVWLTQFEALFLSVTRLTRLALPGMRKRGFGRIIVVVSSGVVQPIPNLGISNAIRLAVVGWAKSLANEVAPEGITVNCIAPGRIATDRLAELDKGRALREGLDVEAVKRQSLATIPAGRYGEPAELASLATFLSSEVASYMSGSVIRVDGGMIRCL